MSHFGHLEKHLENFRPEFLWSVLIGSILNDPRSFTVYYYVLGVFSILVNSYFKISFNLKVTLYMAKIIQHAETELLERRSRENFPTLILFWDFYQCKMTIYLCQICKKKWEVTGFVLERT